MHPPAEMSVPPAFHGDVRVPPVEILVGVEAAPEHPLPRKALFQPGGVLPPQVEQVQPGLPGVFRQKSGLPPLGPAGEKPGVLPLCRPDGKIFGDLRQSQIALTAKGLTLYAQLIVLAGSGEMSVLALIIQIGYYYQKMMQQWRQTKYSNCTL